MVKSHSQEDLQKLCENNYWGPDLNSENIQASKLGLIRNQYLTKLIKFLDNELIKVLVGQRRSGKSYILKQLIHHLVIEKKINPKNILYINFENETFSNITDHKKLMSLIELYYKEIKPSKQKKFYLLLDEIQEIESWEKLVNSYIANKNYDVEIFITGSNSRLLSSELATYISGRYVEINIYPFNYEEFLEIKNQKASFETLKTFLNSSQMPGFYSLTDDLENQRIFIRSLKNSILMNDVIKRFKVKNADLLDKIFSFLIDNLANPFSLNSLQKKLKNIGIKISLTTLGNYIKYLEYSFLIYGIEKFNVKGKRILEGEKKYYLNDIGFRNFLSSSFDPAESKKLENYVFGTLLSKGYEIYIGQIDSNLEIDFVAEKNNHKFYIQVAYFLNDEDVIKREYGNLEKIHDHWSKYVISMDDMNIKPKDGIQQIPAWKIAEIF